MSKKWLILGSVSFGVGLSLSLIINKDIKQAALTGLLSVPATTAGVLVTEHQRQQKLKDRISIKQEQLQALVQQETELNNSITELSKQVENYNQQQEDIKASIAAFDADKLKSQSEFKTLRNRINELDNRKSSLEAEINALEIKLQQLQQQETDLSDSKQHIEKGLKSDRQTVIELRSQKSDLEQDLRHLARQTQQITEHLNGQQLSLNRLQKEKTDLENAIADLSRDKQEFEQQFAEQQQHLKAEINRLQQEKVLGDRALTKLKTEQKEKESILIKLRQTINNLETELSNKQNRKTSLDSAINRLKEEEKELDQYVNELNNQKQSLQLECDDYQRELQNLKQQQKNLSTKVQQLNSLLVTLLVAFSKKAEGDRKDFSGEIVEPRDLNLSNAEHTKYLWQNIISPSWNHKDRPAGYRFLGNLEIDSAQSDRITNLLKEKFQQSEGIPNYLEDNLLKIITFVLSEYAYYSEDEKFWQGFCDRLCIKHSLAVENTFRGITKQGINLLGLIRASGGYKYVSTLWLQSGVPKQNMGHFATILQDVADKYGWWELSHNSAEDIAQALWQCWQNRYSQWGTIRHFLALDNSNEDLEPISGQLVKNIAIVARELEYRNLDPKTIGDREQREEIIANSNISYSFFLRDWDDLVVVLDPRYNSNFSRISKRSNPEPYLYLDVDTLNTLLILPEQPLWKKEWQNLRGSYCLIPEAKWEDTIPSQGSIEIPELEIKIDRATERWRLQLQNHYRNEIYSWEHQGINSEFFCLIFNAISGEHIQIDISKPEIVGIEEIVLFVPKETKIELDDNSEIIDDLAPSSIKGWRGKQIKLTQSEALIQIENIVIEWRSQPEAEPKLIGLRLKGKKDIYINAPTFYYPPPRENLIINYSIEDIDRKSIIARDIFYTYDFNSWNSFDLSNHIQRSGNYYASFWYKEKQWLYKLEVRQEYQATQHHRYRDLEIRDYDNNLLSIPVRYTDLDKFWAAKIKLNNLYPFEELSFRLKNNYEQHQFQTQADSSGELALSLATLDDCLPKSDCYSLDVKKYGQEFQRILQIGYLISWQLTAKQLIFTEIPSANNYCLSGWNLLNPREIEQCDFIANSEPIEVELKFSPGIYLIQLYQDKQLIENIGLWCGIDGQNILDEINNNEALANYCRAILGNKPFTDFSAALKELEVDFDRERIQIILDSLHKGNYYLPQWLDRDSLTEKIQKILESILQPKTLETNNIVAELENTDEVTQVRTISGQWCLVTVRPYKRELFISYLNRDIEQHQLQHLILEIIAPEEPVYSNNILLRISNFIEARKILQKTENFKDVQRLKPNEVSRMLNQ